MRQLLVFLFATILLGILSIGCNSIKNDHKVDEDPVSIFQSVTVSTDSAAVITTSIYYHKFLVYKAYAENGNVKTLIQDMVMQYQEADRVAAYYRNKYVTYGYRDTKTGKTHVDTIKLNSLCRSPEY